MTLRQAQDERAFVAATPRHLGMEYWLSECRVQLMVEAIARGITPEERAEGNLHRAAINQRLRQIERLRMSERERKAVEPDPATLALASPA